MSHDFVREAMVPTKDIDLAEKHKELWESYPERYTHRYDYT